MQNASVIRDEKGNEIWHYGNFNELKENSNIIFKGKNNILFLDKNARLKNTNIAFLGDNSLVFVGNSLLNNLSICTHKDSVCYIGHKNYFNPGGSKKSSFLLSERKHIFIGNENLFSFDLWFRMADPHLIYDSKTCKRINPTKSIFIGDHCWCGQEVGFVKGAFVASGSIIGAKSLVSSSALYSNTINAGIPCKELRQNIFWLNECVHNWDKNTTYKFQKMQGERFKFRYSKKDFIMPKFIDESLEKFNAYERMEFIYKNIHTNTNKNRFALAKKSYLNSIGGGGFTNLCLECAA